MIRQTNVSMFGQEINGNLQEVQVTQLHSQLMRPREIYGLTPKQYSYMFTMEVHGHLSDQQQLLARV